MKMGQIFQSVEAWRKLSSINLKPSIAYAVLKYTKGVQSEFEIADKQRVMLIHDVTGTKEGEEARIEPDSQEFQEYVKRLNEIMLMEVNLPKITFELGTIVEALGDGDGALSVADLANLEPFFATDSEPLPVDAPPIGH